MSLIFPRRFRPDEVFTPRSPSVNQEMYVKRTDLERSLSNAIKGSKNIIVSGESGSGKTWLYKSVFEAEGVTFESVNLSNASLKGSLDAAFRDKNDRLGEESIVEITKTGTAKVAPSGIGVEKGALKKELSAKKDHSRRCSRKFGKGQERAAKQFWFMRILSRLSTMNRC